jgi:putative DNA primase/helicase
MNVDWSEVCRGRWAEIFDSVGVDHKFLKKTHGPCPFCGGEDRYRYTDYNQEGMYICNNCGPGNGFKFLMKYKDVDFRGALELIKQVVGDPTNGQIPAHVLEEIERKKKRQEEIRKLWESGSQITPETAAGRYLTKRTGITEYPSTLRFAKRLPYFEDRKEVGAYPALLAVVSGTSGKLVNVHRTYLTEEGDKAPVKEPRKMMAGKTPGSIAIRLYQATTQLVVAEGLETAISASVLFNAPAWALISADQMKCWVPPQGIQHIFVAGDNDLSYTGQCSAFTLAHRLVCQFKINKVEVGFPLTPGRDWNDVWSGIKR